MANNSKMKGLLDAISKPTTFNQNQFTPDVTEFTQTDDGLVNPQHHLIESTIGQAKTPDEVQQVIQGAQTLGDLTNTAKDQIKQERTILKAGAFSNLNLTPTNQGQPQFTTDQLDMGLQNTMMQYPPEQRQRIIDAFTQQQLDEKRSASEPAIEALGVQQYFPSLGNDNIRVGGYSGKKIGNVDIFVAKGGQLPFGLRDARKRAVQAAAKEKAAIAQKVSQLNIDTAPQYQAQLSDMVMGVGDYYLKAANYDYSELANGKSELSREYFKSVTKLQNQAKEITYVDTIAQKLQKDLMDGRKLPSESITLLSEWQTGKLNLEDFLKEGGKFPQIAEKMKSYDNITKRSDELADQIKETGLTIRPLNPNKMTTDSNYITNANKAFKYSKGSGYDKYMSVMATYFDTEDLKKLVDNEWENNNFYRGYSDKENDEMKAQFAELLVSKIGSKVEVKQDTVANDDLERAKFGWEKFKDERDSKQFYNTVNEASTEASSSAVERIKSIGTSATTEQKTKIIREEYSKRGLTPRTDRNGKPVLGFETYDLNKVTGKPSDQTRIMGGDSRTAFVYVVGKNGTKKSVPLNYLSEHYNELKKEDGTSFTKQDRDDATQILNNQNISIYMEDRYGYDAKLDTDKNVYTPIDRANLNGNSSVHNMVGTSGSVFFDQGVKEKGTDATKQRKSSFKVHLITDNSSEVGQSILGVGEESKTNQLNKVPE